MKNPVTHSLPILFVLVLTSMVAGCNALKKYTDVPVNIPDVVPEISSPTGGDYLGKDVVLGRFIWEDFYEATFFPAKIITRASEETKGEYQIQSLTASPDVAEGARQWTDDVILRSHPAEKDELKVGMVVMYTGGDETVRDAEELEYAKWNRGVILSTDELYKDVVDLRGGIYRRTYTTHLSAIRIIDEAPEHVLKVPAE